MCISCKISENVREKLGVAASVLGVLLCICGLFLIFTGVYIKFEIDDQVMLLEGYSTGMLPHFLISIGTLAACLNGIGSKIAYDCGHAETRGRFQQILLFFIILMFLFCWVIFSGGIVSITHGDDIETAFKHGLKSAMERYRYELPAKQTIDKLQMSMHCCGSSSYKDWFTVDWINRDALNTNHPDFESKVKGGRFLTDDVPFSCCDVRSPRPCVHHSVENQMAHVKYTDITLYKSGCISVLKDQLERKILIPVGNFLMTMFTVQFVFVVLLRYLQTSIHHAYEMGDEEGSGTGYCLPNICCYCCQTGDAAKFIRGGALDKRNVVGEAGTGAGGDFGRGFDDDDDDRRFGGDAGDSNHTESGGKDSYKSKDSKKEKKEKDKAKKNKKDKMKHEKNNRDKTKEKKDKDKEHSSSSKDKKRPEDKSKSPSKKPEDMSKCPSKKKRDKSASTKEMSSPPKEIKKSKSQSPKLKKVKSPSSPKSAKIKIQKAPKLKSLKSLKSPKTKGLKSPKIKSVKSPKIKSAKSPKIKSVKAPKLRK